jgi:hypothetical protein
MNANLFASAIKKVKGNTKPLEHKTEIQAEDDEKPAGDIFSRLKKPQEPSKPEVLVLKSVVGGRSTRLEESKPYGEETADSVRAMLGSRFIPKAAAKSSPSPSARKADSATHRVFVRNIAPEATYEDVKKMFESFGEIAGINVSLSSLRIAGARDRRRLLPFPRRRAQSSSRHTPHRIRR